MAIVEFVPNPDRVSPPAAATFSLVMLATTPQGRRLRSPSTRRCCLRTRIWSGRATPVAGFGQCRGDCLEVGRRQGAAANQTSNTVSSGRQLKRNSNFPQRPNARIHIERASGCHRNARGRSRRCGTGDQRSVEGTRTCPPWVCPRESDRIAGRPIAETRTDNGPATG